MKKEPDFVFQFPDLLTFSREEPKRYVYHFDVALAYIITSRGKVLDSVDVLHDSIVFVTFTWRNENILQEIYNRTKQELGKRLTEEEVILLEEEHDLICMGDIRN